MKILFLGTAASPSIPVPFCQCSHCVEAIANKDRNIRMKSSLLINDDLLIDLGPDTPKAFTIWNVNTYRIKYILQTHAHADHFDPELIVTRHPDYGSQIKNEIVIAGSKKTISKIDDETHIPHHSGQKIQFSVERT